MAESSIAASAGAASQAADVAKRAQITQMQTYISGVQGFFEGVLTDLLLQQPADPHQFLMDALAAMPVSERTAIRAQLASQDLRKNNQEDASLNRSKQSIIVLLTLVANDEAACKTNVLATLHELQSAARAMPSCLRYDLCHNPESTEILVNQQWATRAGLDAFYASPEFARATPKFAGMLAQAPEERLFQPV